MTKDEEIVMLHHLVSKLQKQLVFAEDALAYIAHTNGQANPEWLAIVAHDAQIQMSTVSEDLPLHIIEPVTYNSLTNLSNGSEEGMQNDCNT